MNYIWVDLRTALRAARRSPGITLAIIVMLAFGTGGMTAVFNPIYSTLFAPLPYPQPERLMLVGGDIQIFNGYLNRFEYKDELGGVFSNLTAYASFPASTVTLPGTGKSVEVDIADVSEDFFETLGVLPLRGSSFKQSEFRQAYVVSNRFWRNELMGADDVIGNRINTSLVASGTIIGVMPDGFDFPAGTDIWRYDGINGTMGNDARRYLGRLRPGISHGEAANELRAMEFKPVTGLRGNDGPLLQSLQTVLSGDRRPMLLMLGSAAVLFLLLVCAGVTNLLVTQGARRKSEMALRLIFGASRRNLVFQLLRETLPLVIVSALAGLWISEIAGAWLTARFPALRGGEVVVPVKMTFFGVMVLTVTVIGGLTPALYASGVDFNTYLKSGDNVKRRFFLFPFSLRELLVGIQLSLTLALLNGVGLLTASLMFHVDIPIRWSSRNMAVVRVDFPTESKSAPIANLRDATAGLRERYTRYAMFSGELQEYLSTIPEVASAGIFRPVPFSEAAARTDMTSVGVSNAWSGDPGRIYTRVIEGYANPEGFEMFGITLIAGRHFTQAEITNEIAFKIGYWSMEPRSNTAGGVVIVNQSLARRFWPGENAVGKMIYSGSSNAYEVVGVVRDFHQGAGSNDFIPAVYYPPNNWSNFGQTFLVKIHSGSSMKDFRQRLSVFNDGSTTIEVQSLAEVVSKATADTRMALQLLGGFALLGIVIASLGVYATTSLMAASWTREMGIRLAIGATTWDILRLALWRGIRAILFGLPVGLFMAWILSRVLSSYLFQVKVGDPLVWIISCALLFGITVVAAFIPALRVSRVNPMDALRNM